VSERCSEPLHLSGHRQEGRWAGGLGVFWFKEAGGRAVATLSLAVALTVEGAASQLGVSHLCGAGGGRE